MLPAGIAADALPRSELSRLRSMLPAAQTAARLLVGGCSCDLVRPRHPTRARTSAICGAATRPSDYRATRIIRELERHRRIPPPRRAPGRVARGTRWVRRRARAKRGTYALPARLPARGTGRRRTGSRSLAPWPRFGPTPTAGSRKDPGCSSSVDAGRPPERSLYSSPSHTAESRTSARTPRCDAPFPPGPRSVFSPFSCSPPVAAGQGRVP